jgi:hypothetical protein
MNAQHMLGFEDWRLPMIRELESLTDMGRHSPALPEGHPFEHMKKWYWSSTTSAYEPAYAWGLYLVDGGVGVGYKSKAEFFVWAVRASADAKSEGVGGWSTHKLSEERRNASTRSIDDRAPIDRTDDLANPSGAG